MPVLSGDWMVCLKSVGNSSMANRILIKTAQFIQKVFYTFLDVSGIMLGIFLSWLGYWIISGHTLAGWLGIIVLVIGIGAFIIHVGHYFSLKITRWLFGPGDYFIRK